MLFAPSFTSAIFNLKTHRKLMFSGVAKGNVGKKILKPLEINIIAGRAYWDSASVF